MSHNVIRLASFLLVLGLVVTAFCLERPLAIGSPGQNANSSTVTPQEETNMNANQNTRRRGRRRGRRAPAPAETTTAPAESTAPAETTMPSQTTMPAASMDKQIDLSGTYTGTFTCPDAGLSGEGTLMITGQDFTVADKKGRIVSNTTRGYTGVTMQFGDLTLATAKSSAVAPVIVSMRAKKSGKRLTLTTVPNAGRVCSFTPGG